MTLNRIKSAIPRLYQWQWLSKYFPILLFASAFLLRLGLILTLKTYSSPYHFSEHVRIAENILAGKSYSYAWYGLGETVGSFMPPLYVAIVLAARILFPFTSWLAIQIFQAFLSACTAMLVYFIGREIFTKPVGIIASFLFAVYPPALGYVLDIQSLTLETFLVASTVLTCVYWRKCGAGKWAMAIGFVLGLGVLSRPSLVLLLPLLFIWMILSHGRQGAIHFVVVTGVFALVLGPWTLRNYLVHQEFVFVSTNGGYSMFQGNNVNATGVSYWNLSDLWKQHPRLAKELAQLDDAARAKRLYQESVAFIRTHPKETLSLALRKFVYFWWFKPRFIEGGVASGYPWYFGLIYMGSYAVLLGFSIPGLIISRKNVKSLYIVYALFMIQTATSMIFTSGTRYRGILEPLMIVLAAYGIAWAFPRLFRIFRGAYHFSQIQHQQQE